MFSTISQANYNPKKNPAITNQAPSTNPYEPALSSMSNTQRDAHQANQAGIAKQIINLAKTLPKDADVFDVISKKLPELLKNSGFNTEPYTPRDNTTHGYRKLLLASLPNPNKPICLQVFAFGKSQETPIHDHPVACTSVVAQGTITESLYTNAGAIVRKIKEINRPTGHVARLEPGVDGRDTHSLRNTGNGIAVTVHAYAMDGIINSAAVRNIYEKPAESSKIN